MIKSCHVDFYIKYAIVLGWERKYLLLKEPSIV